MSHNGSMGLFRKSRPGDDVMAAVRQVLGQSMVKVLAWGHGRMDGPVTVIAVEEGLVVVPEQAEPGAVAWHEIIRGGWHKEKSALWWMVLDQSEVRIIMDQPGDIPGVFQSQVNATILCQEGVDVPGGRVVVAGRRRAGALGRRDPSILWTAMAVGEADLSDPETKQLVLEHAEDLKGRWESC